MTTRVRITDSPSGEPRVGEILTVSDHVAQTMLKTGRAEVYTAAPASAGTQTTGAPSPAAEPVLTKQAADKGVVVTPPPSAPPATPSADAPANDPAQPSAAEPAKGAGK